MIVFWAVSIVSKGYMDPSPVITVPHVSSLLTCSQRPTVTSGCFKWRSTGQSFSAAVAVLNFRCSLLVCVQYSVCMFPHNSYIAIANALLKLHIDAHIKMSMCTYAGVHNSQLDCMLGMSQAAHPLPRHQFRAGYATEYDMLSRL